MLGDYSHAEHIYIVCGRTGMHKSIDALASCVKQSFQLDPFSNSLFLLCVHQSDRMKALLWEGNGFVLLYKRLENGRFQWPKTGNEVKDITWQQFRWLIEGLNKEQPNTIRLNNGNILK